jgi:hypothetical protein
MTQSSKFTVQDVQDCLLSFPEALQEQVARHEYLDELLAQDRVLALKIHNTRREIHQFDNDVLARLFEKEAAKDAIFFKADSGNFYSVTKDEEYVLFTPCAYIPWVDSDSEAFCAPL